MVVVIEWYKIDIFPACARSVRAGPKIVLVPPLSIFIYIYNMFVST